MGRYDQRQEKIVANNDIWGRLIADQTDHKTDTFGYHQSNQNLQFGKNIGANKDNSTAGVTLGFGFQSANYKDKNRAFTKAGENTGNSKTSQYHLGAYYSQQNADNQYVDLQTQITSSTTKFNDVNDTSAKQSGLGLAVSAEVGKSFALGDSGFEITPQAQFIYQNTSYKAFNDSVSSVGKQTAESLRVRAGASLKPNNAAAAPGQLNWSTSLNVWQEVLDTPTRTVAGNEVKSNSSQKPWLELGLGLSQKLNEASSLNAQVNLQNSLSGTQKTGASIHLAYQLKW